MNWIIIGVLGAAGLVFFLYFVCFNRRKALTTRPHENWRHYAMQQIVTERGKKFVKAHLMQALDGPHGMGNFGAAIECMSEYFRLLEEQGKDPTKYDSLPVDKDILSRAVAKIQTTI